MTTKFIFGNHLLDLKQNTNENTELQDFYKKNLGKIQEFHKNISIIEDIVNIQNHISNIGVNGFNIEEIIDYFRIYFRNADIISYLMLYFNIDDFDIIKEKIMKNLHNNLDYSDYGKKKLRHENKKTFFKNKVYVLYFHQLLRICIGNIDSLLELMSLFPKDLGKVLLPGYIKYSEEILKNLIIIHNLNTDTDGFHCLQAKLYIYYITIEHNSIINNISLQYLSANSFAVSPANFLINTKVDHRILRGVTKECGIIQENRTISQKEYIGRPVKPVNYEYQIYREISLYSTGSRQDFVHCRGSNSKYEAIGKSLHLYNFSNKVIASEIARILQTGISSINNNKIRETLYELTYILFKCEVERSSSALLSNILFIELLDNDSLTIQDLSSRLPMAINHDDFFGHDAVSCSRSIRNYLGGKYGFQSKYLTKREYYDFKGEKKTNYLSLAARNTFILLDWLLIRKYINSETAVIKYERKFGELISTEYNQSREELKIEQGQSHIKNLPKEFQKLVEENNCYREENAKSLIDRSNLFLYDLLINHYPAILKEVYDLIDNWYGVKLLYLIINS